MASDLRAYAAANACGYGIEYAPGSLYYDLLEPGILAAEALATTRVVKRTSVGFSFAWLWQGLLDKCRAAEAAAFKPWWMR